MGGDFGYGKKEGQDIRTGMKLPQRETRNGDCIIAETNNLMAHIFLG